MSPDAPAPNAPAPDAPRQTPYELVFGHAPFESERFPAIAEEAEQRGTHARAPEDLINLAEAGALLRALIPDDVPPALRGEMLLSHGRLLYHAWHFWRAERPLWLLERRAARYLVEARPRPTDWGLRAPAPAGYLQLPRHLFWGTGEEGAPAEPIDGLFWALFSGDDGPGDAPVLRLLLVLGMRPGRPGFATTAVEAPLGEGPWLAVDARPGGRDFENVLPGGELEGLYAVTTPEEALKLASLAFWLAETGAVEERGDARVITLGGGAGEGPRTFS
ncbi:MAG TPA: hypothetical protein VMK65_10620 [Longimicrobiales bacterium]|nr:hypothetical protein [Longimicrobiales bacterium]